MKKLTFFLAVIAATFTAKADNMQGRDFVNKSMELLMEKPEQLQYKNKSLTANDNRRIFTEFRDFITEVVFSGHDDKLEDPTGPVKDFSTTCSTMSEQSLVARCELLVHYKDSSSASIGFLVQIDASRRPEKIVENTVDINIINL